MYPCTLKGVASGRMHAQQLATADTADEFRRREVSPVVLDLDWCATLTLYSVHIIVLHAVALPDSLQAAEGTSRHESRAAAGTGRLL